ncbi:hypothetical protein [Tardiphaga sp.]|uniref:hypothetical protein n=1 Tax=Tardiphaga sp. TaxID=1926292 RepID=UPI0026283383|nr:hypothetical protein [Tardiphaga sp.]MDB5619666.1 hypothetical protein [Tardiphaga sp.]
MSIKKLLSILAVTALCIPVPQGPALAQYRDGALTAGLIGAALGTAILMQGQRSGPAYQRAPRRSARVRTAPRTREYRNTRDPFASASAPSDYARPVSAGKR